MNMEYCYNFSPLKSFSFDIKKEMSGKIAEAVLHIELSSCVKHKLTLESPKVPSAPSISVRDLFKSLTTESVDSFRVFGKKHEPGLRDSDTIWYIELWKNGSIVGNTIQCRRILGLPKEGWR